MAWIHPVRTLTCHMARPMTAGHNQCAALNAQYALRRTQGSAVTVITTRAQPASKPARALLPSRSPHCEPGDRGGLGVGESMERNLDTSLPRFNAQSGGIHHGHQSRYRHMSQTCQPRGLVLMPRWQVQANGALELLAHKAPQ